MPRRCDHFASRLPDVLDGAFPTRAEDFSHAASCLRCRAELARYRRLGRLLEQLHDERVELPPGLVRDVLARVEEAARAGARRDGAGRVLVVGGAVASALISATAVALAVRRLGSASARRRSTAGLPTS